MAHAYGDEPDVTTTPTVPAKSSALLFGREPAMIAEVIASALVVLNLLMLPGLDPVLQSLINAVVAAAASLYIAVKVRSDSLLPVLVGLFKAGLALVVGLGVPLDNAAQAALLAFVGLVAGMFVRGQVSAPVAVDGHSVPTGRAITGT